MKEENQWPLWVIALIVFGLFAFLYSCNPAKARDLGQWENGDPAVREWYKGLKQPDLPWASCCGEADAYWCDDVHVRDGQTSCGITDDRDDAPLKRPHIAIGTEIAIPANKVKWDKGNPTGHVIVFVNTSLVVFCFVLGGGV